MDIVIKKDAINLISEKIGNKFKCDVDLDFIYLRHILPFIPLKIDGILEFCNECGDERYFIRTLLCQYCNSDSPFGCFYDFNIDQKKLDKYIEKSVNVENPLRKNFIDLWTQNKSIKNQSVEVYNLILKNNLWAC